MAIPVGNESGTTTIGAQREARGRPRMAGIMLETS